jgi:hypothetical protein
MKAIIIPKIIPKIVAAKTMERVVGTHLSILGKYSNTYLKRKTGFITTLPNTGDLLIYITYGNNKIQVNNIIGFVYCQEGALPRVKFLPCRLFA